MSSPHLNLVAPSSRRAGPALDDVQLRVVEHPVGAGHLMVVGAPGTGKTTTAMRAFERRLAAGPGTGSGAGPGKGSGTGSGMVPATDAVLMLAATRRGAARARDAISARLGLTTGRVLVRTPASFAFSVLRSRAALEGEPPPTLITGPEQDAILAELLAGHRAGAGTDVVWPAGIPADALGMRAFRDELRDVLMRAAEAGLRPGGLHRLGERHGRDEWVAAAAVQREYEQVLRLGQLTPDRGERYDVALIVDEAVDALRAWPGQEAGEAPWRFGTVIVDDYQDSTLATARLLGALADDGAELLLFGDADAAVQGFRGGTPALVHAATVDGGEPGALGARRIELPTAWRQRPALRAATAAVTERVVTTGGAGHRRAHGVAEPTGGARPGGSGRGRAGPVGVVPGTVGCDDVVFDDDGCDDDGCVDVLADSGGAPSGVEIAVVRTRAQEAALIAGTLREEHLHHGTPYAAMAVVVRGGSQVSALRRVLGTAGVPVSVQLAESALRDEPSVRALLVAVHVALSGPEAMTGEIAQEILASPLAGADRLDAVSMRSLRRALRAEETAGGGTRAVDVLLVECLGDPARCATLPAIVRRAPTRAAQALAAARSAAAADGSTAETVLWAVWSATGLAEVWRRAALAGGPGAGRADRDLDAVLALFRAAEQFTDRNPTATPAAFVRHMASQDLPADSLAARGGREQAVQVLTAASAAGQEWDVVAVAGVQEDVWPDLRIRDSLLRAHELAELTTGRAGAAGVGRTDLTQARREVLQDELRTFAVAISRARRRVLVTAVRDADLSPSPFLELLDVAGRAGGTAGGTTGGTTGVERGWRTVPVALDLRGLVGRLRAEVPDGPAAAVAAVLLAELAARGVPGADPGGWPEALSESTAVPLWGQGDQVPLSPSTVERAQSCALRWALELAGGRPASSAEQSLGTLVHQIAEAFPHGSAAELRAELDRRWPELGLGTGWIARRQRRSADEMIDRLAGYLEGSPGEVEVEVSFEVDIGRAHVRGTIDRLEHLAPGVVRVVDLKTGALESTDVSEHPQLATYQAAVEHGAFGAERSGGAAIVQLGSGKNAAIRGQGALAAGWAEAMLDEVAGTVAAATFVATPGIGCRTCPVRSSCPAQPDGERVSR